MLKFTIICFLSAFCTEGSEIEEDTVHKFSSTEFIVTSLGAEEMISQIPPLPIFEFLLKVKKSSLPDCAMERRYVLEEYFPEQLPTAIDREDHWEVLLERPSSSYGCYIFDSNIYEGIEWWRSGTSIRNICFEKKFLDRGIFALEDQWAPLSWSLYFEKTGSIPSELVFLHIDDHKDMMSPRIGLCRDKQYVDFISQNYFSLLEPKTVESAIVSGALGKGSILTPLIWQVDKIHVRHLTSRPGPPVLYSLKKKIQPDTVLGHPLQRISVDYEEIETDLFLSSSNYMATSDVDSWLSYIPEDIPIFLHVDMDFFNNRFDGNSSWQEAIRCHDIVLDQQQELLREIFLKLKNKSLERRIVDTSVCLSPGFFPAEFWQPMSDMLLDECKKLGIIS